MNELEASRRSQRHFFRILAGVRLNRDDLTSNLELKREPKRPLSLEETELWAGLSAFDTLEHAREQRGRSPWLGSHAVELVISEPDAILARRTTKTPGHWTIWADPDLLLSYVSGIIEL